MVLVKLKTCDNFEVTVERSTIRKSKMIIDSLDNLALTANPNVSKEELKKIQQEYENPDPIFLEKVNKATYNNVIKWCERHKLESDHLGQPDSDKTFELSDEDSEFFQALNNRALLDLLISANFLDIPLLRLQIAIKLRDKVRGCGPEEIRRIFAK